MCKKIINMLIIFIITIVFLLKTVMVYAIEIKEEITEQDLKDNYISNEAEIEKNLESEKSTKIEENDEIDKKIETEIITDTELNTETEANKENEIESEKDIDYNNEDIDTRILENNDKKVVRALYNDNKTIEDGVYIIKSSIDSNYVIDVSGGSIDNEANIQLFISNNTAAQKFRVKYIEDRYYEIESIKSEKVLDVELGKKEIGTNIWQYEHNETDAQKWKIKKNDDNTYSIISKLNDLYIDVSNGKAQNGQNIQVYSGNETKAQKFIFEEVDLNSPEYSTMPKKNIEDGTYTIKSSINDDYVIDVSGGSTDNEANIQLFISNNTNAQKFNVKYIEDGYYELESVKSGKVLDVELGKKEIGTNIWQYEHNGTDAQKWIIKKNIDDTYSIISKLNDLYIDVSNGIAQNGQNIQVYSGNETKAQKFIFEKTTKSVEFEEGTYGSSGLKIQGKSSGTDLKYYKYGVGPNVFFATFAIHGWEDDFAYDGQQLTKIANAFKDRLNSMDDADLANKWTIYIFPSVNPDGEYHGWTHDGPGRTTLYSDAPSHQGIDMNRTWSTDWVQYTTTRNYTGTEAFQAHEARYLRDFLLAHKSTNGQTVLVDLHGWLNETIGDDGIGSYYRSQLGMSKHISTYGRGYLVNWARANLGSNGRAARASLVELPEAYSSADVDNWGLADKYINATINMLREI